MRGRVEEICDVLKETTESGTAYQTWLDLPLADVSVTQKCQD